MRQVQKIPVKILRRAGHPDRSRSSQEKTVPVHAVLCGTVRIEEEINGEKVDMTTEEAKITNSTSVMMTTVQGDVNAIGYISLGSLNDTVKAARIDGAEATAENIESGSYKVVRPFNVAAKEDLSEAAADFMAFIMSTEGQAVVEENGYIPVSDVEAYAGETNRRVKWS